MLLSPQTLQVITHALTVSADRFDEDARVADEAGFPALAEQFRRQAKDSRAVRTYIEENE